MHIFVANFSESISSHDLEVLFHRYGDVDVASIWVSAEEEELRFAIVEMQDDDEGERAIRKLHRKTLSGNKKKFGGKTLWVEEAPGALVHMLSLCVEAPQILRTHYAWLHDDGDD